MASGPRRPPRRSIDGGKCGQLAGAAAKKLPKRGKVTMAATLQLDAVLAQTGNLSARLK